MRSLNNTDSVTDLAEGEDCLLPLRGRGGRGGRGGAADRHGGGGGLGRGESAGHQTGQGRHFCQIYIFKYIRKVRKGLFLILHLMII